MCEADVICAAASCNGVRVYEVLLTMVQEERVREREWVEEERARERAQWEAERAFLVQQINMKDQQLERTHSQIVRLLASRSQ